DDPEDAMGESILIALIGSVFGGLVGGGVIYRVIIAALENRLRDTFATKSDVNALGTRVNAFESVVLQNREAADKANDRVTLLEQRQAMHFERITERISEEVKAPMERMGGQIDSL